MIFQYGSKEINYLKSRDPKLGRIIDRLGHIDREVDPDLFSAVVHHIVGQQISTKAQATIWARIKDKFHTVNAEHITSAGLPGLQALGIPVRKAEYILEFAQKVRSGTVNPEKIARMSDADAIRELSSLRGIGVWTAEMILLFCLQRPDILSFNDLAIRRGLRMVYHHRTIDRTRFEKYRRRFSPCCSVASLYLWAVANGAIPEMKDYAPQKANEGANRPKYFIHYVSPLGRILLAADRNAVTGLWFEGQKYFPQEFGKEAQEAETPVVKKAKDWLDIYFSGQEPDFTVPVHPSGTDFQKSVWKILCEIPYGKTVTYGEIAKRLAARRSSSGVSAQAVGGAVGRNPVSILIPCHRVIGANGSLTGYAGGLARKKWLLRLENSNFNK